jgi:hypothetical protein
MQFKSIVDNEHFNLRFLLSAYIETQKTLKKLG